MSAMDNHRGLSPVMKAYWTLVKAHRDFTLRNPDDGEATRKILNRMANAKKRLCAECGEMNERYMHMWHDAKHEGELQAKGE